MAHIKIEGVPPWDGDYPLDLDWFTNRELHLIKQIADVRAGELSDEFARGNNDLIVAVTVIAARRNGKDIPVDDIWDAPVGKITLEMDEAAEDEAVPPAKPTSNENGDSGVVSVLPDRSGSSSNESSDGPQETTPTAIGLLG
jgi:hypothetical protein